MIRRLAPRRLGTDEEATVVEHLTELRHRLLIAIAAIVPAFLLAFAFHVQLIEWLKRPLPPDKTLVTLGVIEPFTTAVKVSGLAAIAIVLPILIWQLWGFLAPAVDQATQRILRVFIVFATGLFAIGVLFAYFIVLPAAITFLTNFDDTVYNVQIRASYYLSFTSLVLIACGLAFEMPIFILALVRIRVLTYDKLRHNRRIGYALMVAFAILLPTVDPVSLLFETIPLLILFEISIWLSRIMEKRWGLGLADGNGDETAVDDGTSWDDEEAGVDDPYLGDDEEAYDPGTRDELEAPGSGAPESEAPESDTPESEDPAP
jgi:sec-independent protein translocase protein TatC